MTDMTDKNRRPRAKGTTATLPEAEPPAIGKRLDALEARLDRALVVAEEIARQVESGRAGALAALSPVPAWLNLHAVVDEQTCGELQQLSDRIEAAIQGLVPDLEQCYRVLRKVDDASSRLAGGDDAWQVIHKHSGAERLSNLLYLLSAQVDGAAGEKVDNIYNIEWLTTARAEFGLDEWNMPTQTGSTTS